MKLNPNIPRLKEPQILLTSTLIVSHFGACILSNHLFTSSTYAESTCVCVWAFKDRLLFKYAQKCVLDYNSIAPSCYFYTGVGSFKKHRKKRNGNNNK